MLYPFKYSLYSRTFFLAIITLDAFCLYLAFGLSFKENFGTIDESVNPYFSFYAIWLLLWIIIALSLDQYNTNKLKRARRIVLSTAKVVLVHLLCIFVYLLIMPPFFSINDLIGVYFFSVLITIGAKMLLLFSYWVISNRPKNKINFIIVGHTTTTRKLLTLLQPNKKFGHRFLGFFDVAFLSTEKTESRFLEITLFCQANNINQIYFTSPIDHPLITKLATYANNNFIHFTMVQDAANIPPDEVKTLIYNNTSVVARPNFSDSPELSPTTKKISSIL